MLILSYHDNKLHKNIPYLYAEDNLFLGDYVVNNFVDMVFDENGPKTAIISNQLNKHLYIYRFVLDLSHDMVAHVKLDFSGDDYANFCHISYDFIERYASAHLRSTLESDTSRKTQCSITFEGMDKTDFIEFFSFISNMLTEYCDCHMLRDTLLKSSSMQDFINRCSGNK